MPLPRFAAVCLVLLCACDPTATRLTPKKLEFTFAAHTRSFDREGNLLLTGFNKPFIVRMNRTTQDFQDFSQGLPSDTGPNGEIFADTAGNLSAGGWYRGAADTQWVKLTAPPNSTRPGPNLGLPLTARVFTLDGTGVVYAVMNDRTLNEELYDLYRLQPPAGAWEKLTNGIAGVNLDASGFKATLDGTVFINNQVWVPGTTDLKPLLKCPTLRIDQTCEAGLQVFAHPRRKEVWLVALPNPGLSSGKVFKVPAGATYPLDFDALTKVELAGNQWRALRMSSDGTLHVGVTQDVTLDYPPYAAQEATYYALTDVARPEGRLLYSAGQVVSDTHEVYKASAQLVGGTWSADPVYVWKF